MTSSTSPTLFTFTTAEAVELATVSRSGFVESRHAGSAVVVSPTGEVLRTLGNPDAPIFPRSCLKPFQAVAVLDALLGSGVTLDDVQTVLATASHAATRRHVEVVESILRLAGVDSSSLQCPADWPGDSAARDDLIREGSGRASVYMNCSGKHAAMLLACVTNGWPTESYLDIAHPLQQRILETVERLCRETVSATGIDGCGAPIHAISLTGLARGISTLTQAASGPAHTLTQAVLANGWAIDGPGRANTLVIDELGVFSKLGAEGVMVMAVPGGTTVALKVLDGSLRAASLVGLTLLVGAGALAQADVDRVVPGLDLTVTGGGLPVGRIAVAPHVLA